MSLRDVLAEAALARIPTLLTLQDRNPHSPTYGCFDRNYWHYRILDFPTGMAQELVWPLALVWDLPLPNNPYRHDPAIAASVRAGMRFAARRAHADGSCDDYFPYERAGGAASFSLLAFLDSAARLGIDEPALDAFFRRRTDWLAGFDERGRLTNHQALIALILALAGRHFQTDRWRAAGERRLARILDWQDPEGWFPEYEGCDPGYQSITLALLARLYDLDPRPELAEALRRGLRLAREFVFPDGSYGGELGSRNAYNAFLYGFERCARWMPEAAGLTDRLIRGRAAGLHACHDDDHHIAHHLWDALLTWQDYAPDRPPAPPRAPGRQRWPRAGLLIDRRGDTELYVAINKGGSFKLFRNNKLLFSDTGLSLLTAGPRPRNAVAHLVDAYAVQIGADEIRVAGRLGWAKQRQMDTPSLLALRGFMATAGRPFPNLARGLLQRMLIQGKRPAPFTFERVLRWEGAAWSVTDTLRAPRWDAVAAVGVGGHQTSIYVTMSRTFQAGQLQPWLDLTPRLAGLSDGAPLIVRRALSGAAEPGAAG